MKTWRIARVGCKTLFVEVDQLGEDVPVPLATKHPQSHFAVDLTLMSDGELLNQVIKKAKIGNA